MLGILKYGWKAGKFFSKAAPLVTKAFDDDQPDPEPGDKFGEIVIDVAVLVRTLKQAKADGLITRDEVTDLIVDAVCVILKHAFGIELKRG